MPKKSVTDPPAQQALNLVDWWNTFAASNPRAATFVASVGLAMLVGAISVAVSGSLLAAISLFIFVLIAGVLIGIATPPSKAVKVPVETRVLSVISLVILIALMGVLALSVFTDNPVPLKTTISEEMLRGSISTDLKNAVRGLSPNAMQEIAAIGTPLHGVSNFDVASNSYIVAPIPSAVDELSNNNLIEWSISRAEFEKVAAKYDISLPAPGEMPKHFSPANVSEDDKKILSYFSYRLNPKGLLIYQRMVDTLIKLAG